MRCEICKQEKGAYLENGRCYSCRRRHFEDLRPPLLFDFLTDEDKKRLIR